MADYPPPEPLAASPNIQFRLAKASDAQSMADSFFRSFGASAKFWFVTFPEDPWNDWWRRAWLMGISEDPTTRTFVAVDMDKDPNKVIAFSRWIVPQPDGNLERKWPDMPDVDMSVVGPFFQGMAENREITMGKEPHWFLEMLGTDTEYQRKGIGYAFCKWGCDLADKDDMRVYIDASQIGAPFYRKHLGAEKMKLIEIPDRDGPDGFGHYEYWTHVVPRKSQRE